MSLEILQKSVGSLRKKAKEVFDDDDDDEDDEDEDESSSDGGSESSDEESSSESDVKPAPKKKERQNEPRKAPENRQKSSNIDLLLELENCECFQFRKLSFSIIPLYFTKKFCYFEPFYEYFFRQNKKLN